jgi:hypothetical protein
MRNIAIAAAAIASLATITACGSTAAHDSSSTASQAASSSVPASPSAAAAPAVPEPDGTYSGSCDYTLSDDFTSSISGTLTGEIDIKNTGNVGSIIRARITWPQEGYIPVAAHRTVHVRYGSSKTVRFHLPATSNVIDNLQSWQEHHGFRDGCTFRATITGFFGTAH